MNGNVGQASRLPGRAKRGRGSATWPYAVERLALRAVAPVGPLHRQSGAQASFARAGSDSGRPLCAGGVFAARPLLPPHGHVIAVSEWARLWRAGLWIVASAVLGLFFAGPIAAAPLRVVTTLPPIYCLTASVAGDFAKVENLLPPGAAAHDFQFTFADRRILEQADLIVANGLGLEPWLDKALKKTGSKRVVRCAEGLELEPDSPAGGAPNPHVWLDPILASGMVAKILAALQQADPSHAAGYGTNAAAFARRLRMLDEELRAGLATLPNKAIITSHDAFPYMARRYGLEVVGVIEEHPEIDPSPAHLSVLRTTVKKRGVKALFVDAHEQGRRVRQLGRDFGVAVGVLDTLEQAALTPSAYEEGMRRNLRALQQALN